jgi:hypothetical protein
MRALPERGGPHRKHKEIDMADTPIPSIGIPDEILHGTRQEIENFSVPMPQPASPQQPAAPPPPPKGMSAIEDLLQFGSLKHEATILGMRFTVRTLKIVEKEEAYGAVSHLPATSFVHFSSLRDELLARALDRVNSLPLSHYYRPDPDDNLELSENEKRVMVVKKMYGPIVDKLYELYNILEEKSSKALDSVSFDDLKNS